MRDARFKRSSATFSGDAQAIGFLIYLAAVFALGGASRSDVASLIYLRPLTVVATFAAYALGGRSSVTKVLGPFLALAALISVIVLQLIPLPPELWGALPGRGELYRGAHLAGVGAVWRPINLWPDGGWNSLFACFAPLSVLLGASLVDPSRRRWLLALAVSFGLLSGVIGLLQVLGPSGGPLYFYEITNSRVAVGLFANRNHQAILLVSTIPMLAALATLGVTPRVHGRIWQLLCLAAAIFVIPLITISGSRAGLLLMFPAILATPFVMGWRINDFLAKGTRANAKRYALIGGAAGLIALLFLIVYFSRSLSLTRLLDSDAEGDLRFSVIEPIAQMISAYFPVGSGFGSFAEVFRRVEPDALLSSGYLNHAHDEFLELLVEGGLAGALLVFAGFYLWIRSAFVAFASRGSRRSGDVLARAGVVILSLLVLASVVDYPLRTPSLAALAALAVVWVWTASIDAVKKGSG